MIQSTRIRAISPAAGIFISLLISLSLWVLWSSNKSLSMGNIILLVVLIFIICWTAYYLINPRYLTEEGVDIYCLGKLSRRIQWNQIEQICIINDFHLSSGSSDIPRIVITPIGCEKFDSKKWFGLQYLFIFRKHVIWIDNTKQNRQFIEQHYGEILNLRYT